MTTLATDRPAPLPSTIAVARYRFTAKVQQPLQLPDYAGSLLRGQFGAALRNVACMTRQPTCPGCPLLQTCPYTRVFEAPPPPKGAHALQDFSQIPNPYIVEPPTPGARLLDADDALVFHMVLVGHAIEQLPLIIFALQRALAQGLTKARIPAELVQVDHVDGAEQPHCVWHAQRPTLAEHKATLTLINPPDARTLIATRPYSTGTIGQSGIKPSPMIGTEIVLSVTTPLRLQQQGRPLGVGQLTPRALVAALARRMSLLMEFHAAEPNAQYRWGEAAKAITRLSETLHDTRTLHWHDWTRYSSRQQQEMTLGGVLGRWTLRGSPEVMEHLYPWLWLGQWLHVGKNATMGMGGYTLEPAPSDHAAGAQ